MSAKPPPGLFITGTDTCIGKTYVAAAIARSLVVAGIRVGVYKPVLSGYTTAVSQVNLHSLDDCQDDDVVLWHAASKPGDLRRVAPQRFRAPIAPHLAARVEGREVDVDHLRSGVDYWRERSDFVLVEGAGGLLSPISNLEFNADVARDIGYPLLIVVPNRLGALNQTLVTLLAASVYRGGLRIASVILNDLPGSAGTEEIQDANVAFLRQRCEVPIFRLKIDERQFADVGQLIELEKTAQVPLLWTAATGATASGSATKKARSN